MNSSAQVLASGTCYCTCCLCAGLGVTEKVAGEARRTASRSGMFIHNRHLEVGFPRKPYLGLGGKVW